MSVPGSWRVGLLATGVLALLLLALVVLPARVTDVLNAGSTVLVAAATVGLAVVGHRTLRVREEERRDRIVEADARVGALAYFLHEQVSGWVPAAWQLKTDSDRREWVEKIHPHFEEAERRLERLLEQVALASPDVTRKIRLAARLFWFGTRLADMLESVHVTDESRAEVFGDEIEYDEATRKLFNSAGRDLEKAADLLLEVIPPDLRI